MSLAYGDEAAQDGPFVTVTTHVWARTLLTYGATPTQKALAGERDRLFHQTGIDEPEPADAHTENLRMPFEDVGLTARVRHEGSLWSAEVRLSIEDRPAGTQPRDRAFAIVVSRGVPVQALALRLEHDLQPLWNARDTWVRLKIQRSAEDPEPEPLPATKDLRGLEELIGSAVAGRPIGHRSRAPARCAPVTPRPAPRMGGRTPDSDALREPTAGRGQQVDHDARKPNARASDVGSVVGRCRSGRDRRKHSIHGLRQRGGEPARAATMAQSDRRTRRARRLAQRMGALARRAGGLQRHGPRIGGWRAGRPCARAGPASAGRARAGR